MASPPKWLAELVDRVSEQIYAVDVLAPLGCHFYRNKTLNQWEVTLFASRTATIGGKQDGRVTASRFNVDLRRLLQVFPDSVECHWQALSLGPDDQLGPHLSIEGEYKGHLFWLRVLAVAPRQIDIGRTADAYSMRLVDHW